MAEIAERLNCILLVDDDEVTNFINEKLIGRMGITDHVHTSRHGKAALKFIEENFRNSKPTDPVCPQLILLDINMPVMDGFEFMEKFNACEDEKKNQMKIVMLTSSEDERDLAKARSLNVQKVICKPLTEDKLRSVMN